MKPRLDELPPLRRHSRITFCSRVNVVGVAQPHRANACVLGHGHVLDRRDRLQIHNYLAQARIVHIEGARIASVNWDGSHQDNRRGRRHPEVLQKSPHVVERLLDCNVLDQVVSAYHKERNVRKSRARLGATKEALLLELNVELRRPRVGIGRTWTRLVARQLAARALEEAF